MANKSPVMTKEFEKAKIRAIGTTEKMGSKVFGIRFPEDVEKELLSMNKEERVPFIRDLVINAIRK